MAWNETTRAQYKRPLERFETDVTDAEWALIEPLLPPPSRLGRRRRTDLREVFNAIQFMLGTGCQWRAIPVCFPPFTTVQNDFYGWRDDGTLARMLDALRGLARAQAGRAAEPTAAAIDSQSVKTSESGGPAGYDAGKRIKGRKRHLAVDVDGTPIVIRVHEASVQDRDGAPAPQSSGCGRRRQRWPSSGRMAATGDRNWPRRCGSWGSQSCWRLCQNRRIARALPCCTGAGSWSGRSPGCRAAGGWPRTSSGVWKALWPGYNWRPAGS